MKKVLSLVLALSMVLGMFSFAFATDLSDIEGQYYQAAVEALVELGVVNGYPDGTYKANEVVTRAELAKMLVVCLGQEEAAEIAKGTTQFSDVASDYWAAGYINVATQYKVIVGYPDGTFLPEESVTYAEAVTMVLRALGYKNVVETAGTWPTNYITKANELQLLKDTKGLETNAGAKRGNVAIILWNMLRTKMWDIQSENQTNGMTFGQTDYMLNVKFPDYTYDDEAYFSSLEINDGKAFVTVYPEMEDDAFVGEAISGEITKGDLLRLVPTMKVAALYNKDTETFLTLTPIDTVVEGTVTATSSNKFEIDDVQYRNNAEAEVEVNDYVVAIADGKKLTAVVKLPTTSTEVEKIRTMENKIDEDALVIIDGEWATRDDIEVGDVYTEIEDLEHITAGSFFAVAREREEGTFESFTVTTNKDVSDRYSIEVDGHEYTALDNAFVAYEGEDNDEPIDVDTDGEGLREKAKDNKYLDKDVELVFNYLGQVVKMYFGEVSDLDATGDFFVMTSDGSWYTAGAKGKVYHVVLAAIDGSEEEYDFASSSVGSRFDSMGYFTTEADFAPFFAYAELNNDGEIRALEEVENEGTYGKDDKYTASEFTGEIDEDNYLSNDLKVTASTIVMTATPVLDDDDNVIEVKVEVTEGPDALEGVDGGIAVYETEGTTPRAKFVFVSQEAESQELNFGLVEEYREKAGKDYVVISGERYEIDEDNDLEPEVGSLVAFTNTDGVVIMKKACVPADVDGSVLVTDVTDEFVTFEKEVPVDTEGTLDTSIDKTLDSVKELYKDYTFVLATAGLDEEDTVEFDADVESFGKGVENATFKKNDRVSMTQEADDVKVVIIIRGLDKDDTFVDGVAQTVAE